MWRVGCVPEELADGGFLTSQVRGATKGWVEVKGRVERCWRVLVEHEVGSSGQCRPAVVVL
jgi:hypothetical protein